VVLLEWMSIVGVMLPLSTSVIWLYISTGNYKHQLKVNVFITIISLFIYGFVCSQFLSYSNIIIAEIFIYSILIPFVTLIHSHYLLGIDLMKTVFIYTSIFISSVFSSFFIYYLFLSFDFDLNFIVLSILKTVFGLLFYFTVFRFLFWKKIRGLL